MAKLIVAQTFAYLSSFVVNIFGLVFSGFIYMTVIIEKRIPPIPTEL